MLLSEGLLSVANCVVPIQLSCLYLLVDNTMFQSVRVVVKIKAICVGKILTMIGWKLLVELTQSFITTATWMKEGAL